MESRESVMAVLRVYESIDMSNTHRSIGEVTYYDKRLLVVENDYYMSTYYIGNFTYPGGQWKGTIRAIEVYDEYNYMSYQLSGLSASTRIATVGYSGERAMREVFAGDDRVNGSDDDDILLGHAGADAVRGNDGDDTLYGGADRDALFGGRGDDLIYGGAGRDVLTGGKGADRLRGNADRDIFEFTTGAGKDTVVDFTDKEDWIRILSGADRYSELDITETRGGVRIRFGTTEVTLSGVEADEIGRGDFLFA